MGYVCTRPDSLLFTLASPHCQSVNLYCISKKPQVTYWTRSGQCSPLSDPRQGTTPALFALMSTSTPVLVCRRARLTSWQLFVHHVIIVLGSFSKSWIWNGDLSSPTQVSWYARPSRLQYLLHQEIQETQKRILTWQLWFWKRWYGKPMLSASSTDEEDAQFQRLRIKRRQSLKKRWQRSVLVSKTKIGDTISEWFGSWISTRRKGLTLLTFSQLLCCCIAPYEAVTLRG